MAVVVVRRRLARATSAAIAPRPAWPAFVCAGLAFVVLAMAAPIVASGTYAPLRIVDGRTVPMVAVALLTLAVGAAAAVRGAIVLLRSRHDARSARARSEAGSDLALQVWALTTLIGTVFILS